VFSTQYETAATTGSNDSSKMNIYILKKHCILFNLESSSILYLTQRKKTKNGGRDFK